MSRKVAATDECMAKYPLQIVEATAEDRFRYHLPDRNRRYRVRVQLPSNLTCSQCVFQWTYTAGRWRLLQFIHDPIHVPDTLGSRSVSDMQTIAE